MPTFNKMDMMNCCRGWHDFSEDGNNAAEDGPLECKVCGVTEDEASTPNSKEFANPSPTDKVLALPTPSTGCYALSIDHDKGCELHLFTTEAERDAFLWNYAFEHSYTELDDLAAFKAEHGDDLGSAMEVTGDGWLTDDMVLAAPVANHAPGQAVGNDAALVLLREAVEAWPQFDRTETPLMKPGVIPEGDEPVDGGDMVEWFGFFHAKAKDVIAGNPVAIPPHADDANDTVDALVQAEAFISGFEDDDLQEGIPDLLAGLRKAIAREQAAPDMLAALKAALRQMRAAYGRLHDFLSDTIEGGRLKESDLPDDYQAIVEQLAGPCCDANERAKKLLAEIDAL